MHSDSEFIYVTSTSIFFFFFGLTIVDAIAVTALHRQKLIRKDGRCANIAS